MSRRALRRKRWIAYRKARKAAHITAVAEALLGPMGRLIT